MFNELVKTFKDTRDDVPGHFLISRRDIQIQATHRMIRLQTRVQRHHTRKVKIVHSQVKMQQ